MGVTATGNTSSGVAVARDATCTGVLVGTASGVAVDTGGVTVTIAAVSDVGDDVGITMTLAGVVVCVATRAGTVGVGSTAGLTGPRQTASMMKLSSAMKNTAPPPDHRRC
jgi:hypothetical protein